MDLTSIVRKLRARVDGMITRAVITRVNGALKTVRLQVSLTAGELEENVELMQPYGVSFTPPVGAEALTVAVQGARSHTVAICAQHPGERPTDAPAQAGGLYTKAAWRVYVDDAGVVCIGGKDSAQHLVLGDLLKLLYSAHVHPTAMGPSGPPTNAGDFAQVLSKHKVAP